MTNCYLKDYTILHRPLQQQVQAQNWWTPQFPYVK